MNQALARQGQGDPGQSTKLISVTRFFALADYIGTNHERAAENSQVHTSPLQLGQNDLIWCQHLPLFACFLEQLFPVQHWPG